MFGNVLKKLRRRLKRLAGREQLETELLFLRAMMENTADSIYFKDRECRLLWVNRKLARDLDCSDPTMVVGKTDIELFGEEFGAITRRDDLHVMETGTPLIGIIESRRTPDGGLNWTSTTKLPLRDAEGHIHGLMGITREINELKRLEQDYHYRATHDPLTGLPNRFLMFDRMQQYLARSSRTQEGLAVIFIDLDNFKNINDRWGHAGGDRLLEAVGARLTAAIRESDTAARLGGDEFLIVMEGTHRTEALPAASKLLEAIAQPVILSGESVSTSASFGVSLYPEHGCSPEELVSAADQALYTSKRQGKNQITIYADPSQNAINPTRRVV